MVMGPEKALYPPTAEKVPFRGKGEKKLRREPGWKAWGVQLVLKVIL
jgi:hypothetical protein